MDGEGFDRFARGLGRSVDRRGVLGGMAAGLAGLAGVAAIDDATAKKGKKGKKTCAAPKTRCGKQCVDTNTNAKYCGGCDTACANDETCVDGACVGKCGKGMAKFSQDFEKNTSGWHGPIEQVKSGANGINARHGKSYATVPGDADINTDTGVFTRWGNYSGDFPKHGYATEIAIYLDPAGAPQTATQFDYSSAINGTDCKHRRDFIFTVGVDTDAVDPTFCITASNNSPGAPCNPDRDPARVTDTGWYRLPPRLPRRQRRARGRSDPARSTWERSQYLDPERCVRQDRRHGRRQPLRLVRRQPVRVPRDRRQPAQMVVSAFGS